MLNYSFNLYADLPKCIIDMLYSYTEVYLKTVISYFSQGEWDFRILDPMIGSVSESPLPYLGAIDSHP